MGLLAPRLSMIELFLNVDDQPLTHTDYYGVYQMVEKFKIQKNRIELAKLLPTDTTEPNVSGGYIFKFEWQATEPPTIACAGAAETCWSDLELVEPDAPNSSQIAYLGNYLQAFNTALHSAMPADPVSGYPAYIDVSSFVDQVIINEFTRNMDAYGETATLRCIRRNRCEANGRHCSAPSQPCPVWLVRRGHGAAQSADSAERRRHLAAR